MKLINPLPSSDQFVYHYTKLDTALSYILKTGTLKLNSFSGVNDPRESKNWTIAANIRAAQNLDPEGFDRISDHISGLLKSNTKVICFSKDRKEAARKWQPDALPDRGFARPSMWHHYADAHAGVCLMFDRGKLDVALGHQLDSNRIRSGEISYSDAGIVMRLGQDPFYIDLTKVFSEQEYIREINKHLNTWLPQLFFRKLKDWSNEEEYRWVFFDDNSEPRFLKFDDALEAVIIGERVPKTCEQELLMYCAKYEAEIAHLEWRNGYPAIVHPGQPYVTHRHLLDAQDEVSS